jgi:hypothetical protein
MHNLDGCADFSREDIQILSNRGWNSILFHFIEAFQIDDETLILISLKSFSKYWDRRKLMVLGSELVLTEDYRIDMHQVILSQSKLNFLLNNLENWLLEPFEFMVDISGGSGATIILSVFQQEEKTVGNRDRPVIKLFYSSHQTKTEWCFVTDYTCLNILSEGLRSWKIAL